MFGPQREQEPRASSADGASAPFLWIRGAPPDVRCRGRLSDSPVVVLAVTLPWLAEVRGEQVASWFPGNTSVNRDLAVQCDSWAGAKSRRSERERLRLTALAPRSLCGAGLWEGSPGRAREQNRSCINAHCNLTDVHTLPPSQYKRFLRAERRVPGVTCVDSNPVPAPATAAAVGSALRWLQSRLPGL